MKKMFVLLMLMIFVCTLSSVALGIDISADGPLLEQKSSIRSLKIGMNYLEHRDNHKFLPKSLPMPLMDPGYFDFGEWAFYADDYFREMLRPSLNGYGDKITLKPLELTSRMKPYVIEEIGKSAALVRVEYPRHEELERLLQKLYFNLIRGPVILSVAYSSKDIPDEYSEYSNWQCFKAIKDPSVGVDGDVHIVYVDWSKIHSVVAFLDGGRIRVADNGQIYDVDHSALVAQANAIMALPDSSVIMERSSELNYLLYFSEQKVAWKK